VTETVWVLDNYCDRITEKKRSAKPPIPPFGICNTQREAIDLMVQRAEDRVTAALAEYRKAVARAKKCAKLRKQFEEKI